MMEKIVLRFRILQSTPKYSIYYGHRDYVELRPLFLRQHGATSKVSGRLMSDGVGRYGLIQCPEVCYGREIVKIVTSRDPIRHRNRRHGQMENEDDDNRILALLGARD